MKALLTTVLVALGFAFAIGASAEVKPLFTDAGVGFELTAPGAKSVVIRPGSIFFETTDGRTVLTGKPASAERIPLSFAGTWDTPAGISIAVTLAHDARGTNLRLSTKSNVEIRKWGIAIQAAPDEYFTGAMERVVDGSQGKSWEPGIAEGMNLRGQLVEMVVKPTTALYSPFYVSSAGYGLFVRGTWPGGLDFCRYDPNAVLVEFEGPQMEVQFYHNSVYSASKGVDLAAIVRAHAMEAGPPVMPPKWAFSPWRWRDDHSNRETYFDGTPVTAPYNSMVVEDILMMRALDIPCGVYWIDRPWATGPNGYDDFEWDTNRLPNPQRMIRWLGAQDIRMLLWIAPWVQGEIYKLALEKGYNLAGQTGANDSRALIDFTNPTAVDWWQQGVKKVLDDGVAGFKLDRSEEIVPNKRDITAFNGETTRELHNDYPHLYVKATYDITKRVRRDDFVLMPRAAYTGSSRYAAFWGGDIGSSEWGLRASIVAVQRAAVMGYPFWGSDTCGYTGTSDHEVCARWVAFSCFCPIMEVGPTRNRAFWDMPSEPSYDPELLAIWRTYAKLHTALMDYSYKYAREAHTTGAPIVRPLFMAYPDQKPAYDNWETYLYGDDILVSPVWQKGATTKRVYLPAGETWIDAWDGTAYRGGVTFAVDVPLHKIPVFIRRGASVQLGDINALYQDSLKRAGAKPSMAELQKSVK